MTSKTCWLSSGPLALQRPAAQRMPQPRQVRSQVLVRVSFCRGGRHPVRCRRRRGRTCRSKTSYPLAKGMTWPSSIRQWGQQGVQVKTAGPLLNAVCFRMPLDVLSCLVKELGADVTPRFRVALSRSSPLILSSYSFRATPKYSCIISMTSVMD